MVFRETDLRRIFGAAVLGASACTACGTSDEALEAGVDATTDDAMDDSTADSPTDDVQFTERDAFVAWCDAGPPEFVELCGGCCAYYFVPCGLPDNIHAFNEAGSLDNCAPICGDAGNWGCGVVSEPPDAAIAVDGGLYVLCGCTGRRHEGYKPHRAAPTLGAHFAEMARLEAASVFAFERLGSELAALAAPASLVARARRSMEEERRHARVVGGLAARFGGRVVLPKARWFRPRSVERMAIENVVEGCARETYGALVGTWQAEHAADAGVRRVMRVIARDETRHAALATSVAAFVARKLDARSRDRVSRARERAIAELRIVSKRPPPAALGRPTGLPSASQAAALLDALARSVWLEPSV